ncbi:MAG: hypothetical protein EOO28_23680 [Comamonadaceae bacterium]|nr:MAG: hypothetical protein EOO28_23680 [Comamonadaceae bacterium]
MTNPPLTPPADGPLAEALAKSQAATEEVKLVAEDLAVVHSVLKTKLLEVAKAEGDVDAAVARTGEAAEQLDKATQVLDRVNQTLADNAKPA